MKNIGNKKLLLLITTAFIFIIFLPSIVDAGCHYPCAIEPALDPGCYYTFYADINPGGESHCRIGSVTYVYFTGYGFVQLASGCSYSTGECKVNACPNIGSRNGQSCAVAKDCADLTCWARDCSGTWDASNKWCVGCSGLKKVNRYGSSSGIDVTCGSCSGYDITDSCEYACGSPANCDDKSTGVCSNSGKTYCKSDCSEGDVDDGQSYCNACGFTWATDVSKCCGDDTGETWSSTQGVCCNGVWKSGGKCCIASDCTTPCANHAKPTCTSNTCGCAPCLANSDCESGYPTCWCGSCSSLFTSAGCPSGQCCNRGYGGTDIGSCVAQGNIYSSFYLCDPPEWSSKATILTPNDKPASIVEAIWNFLASSFGL